VKGQNISLASCRSVGSRCTVCSVTDGSLEGRFWSMGIHPGVVVEIVRNDGDPVYIRVDDARYGLGRTLAEKILVRPLPEN
jgi:Fe2+ transport system protein FeoA